MEVAVEWNRNPFGRSVDISQHDTRSGAPRGDAECYLSFRTRRAGDADRHQTVPGVVRVKFDRQVSAGDARGGVLVDGERTAVARGQVVVGGGEEAHDVRGAAGALEPFAAAARVVLLVVVDAALQGVDVEEPVAFGVD